MRECKHKRAVVTFKTVTLYDIKTSNGIAKLPKTIKIDNLCIKEVYCLDCQANLEYRR